MNTSDGKLYHHFEAKTADEAVVVYRSVVAILEDVLARFRNHNALEVEIYISSPQVESEPAQ
jgi:hypothetical protein